LGRYSTLRVDADGPSPRLLGLRDDGRTMIEAGAMSEGTTDQLFLALRLAALEQSVAAGINLPFLANDLFVNFDNRRAEAGFKVLAEVAKSTQALFFTHHPHLVAIAESVVGAELHSGCARNRLWTYRRRDPRSIIEAQAGKLWASPRSTSLIAPT
jgi:uncharacterized protein YhaN